ncbi:toll/interleukin-1 receptor domain-containing protein [Tautonia plasticadhaerens]|uniref:toll/interleukin-1 receptor domain-containing protein n=1 Tax=Tautonia plasticadhaerens TaxID=2527974 RepID=UPI001E56BAFE|nr:toll/interleukin-1 receptor domain-containing protein [Tautonia plasticadhaerens]
MALDLSETKGLELVTHQAPSMIGTDTLIRSRGIIPAIFLRGCGLPDAWIANLPTLIGAIEPNQFYSCFISYSTADEEFASRLHNDLQAAGIRCWKWDHDARTGRSLWGEIDQAIRVHDKLVLIASQSSLKSPAVNREIERAIIQEDEKARAKRGRRKIDADVLFPVTLDDFIFKKWQHERRVDVTKKVIADARGWDLDAAIYAKVREKLLRDLKTGDTATE